MTSERTFYIFSALVGLLHSKPASKTYRRILIYKLDHIGDLLLATPAVRAIRQRFPEAEIRMVVGEWNIPLLQNNPHIGSIIIYNSPRFTRKPYTPHTFSEVGRQLGSWKPDLIVGLRDDWQTVAASIFSRARRIERGLAHFHFWLRRIRTKESSQHEGELDRIWQTLRALGIAPDAEPQLDFFPTDEERREAGEFLLAHGIRQPFALIQAGATTRLREWPLDRFAAMARWLHDRYAMQIVLIGLPREAGRSAELAALIGDLQPIDITGALSLRPMAAAMELAALYLGSDGGSMHLAATAGIPTVGLFGPGSYHVFRPVGRKTVGISHHFACSPCDQVECIRPDDTCMQAVTTDEVMRAIARLLADESGEEGSSDELVQITLDSASAR
jgi:ADP-heptose:LPS heptosyltransferase